MKSQKLTPEYSKQADKYLSSLDSKSEQRLKKGIERIPAGDIIPYKAHPGYYRLRIGNYRILFKWLNDKQILIALIDSRGQIYKKGV
ncbi:MAG: type II toxin-antitoxin system RelE/ParE family toxin [Oscillospiraceae bacterium]|nr:type II toxin-antitoxin system RelE/ParE family toxin [Oscillospiraceae bacterium]